jgi:hypothetical protein
VPPAPGPEPEPFMGYPSVCQAFPSSFSYNAGPSALACAPF